ncbi:MAG TPA: type II secretion system F family protein [Actinomycetota bacterium]
MAAELIGPACAVAAGFAVAHATAVGERRRLLVRAGADVGHAVPVGPGPLSRLRGGGPRPRLALTGATAAIGTGFGAMLAGPAGAIAGLAAGVWVPRRLARRRVAKHEALIEQQLADAMDGIAAALRAGMSPSQAIAFACEEGEPPLADDLRAVVGREALGMPLDESLELLAREEGSDDVRLAVAVLQLQHRVGGDAPAVLDDAVRTLRQRVAAAAELRSLTAQARLSGTILGLLPIGFFLFMSVVSRSEVAGAIASPIGLAAIVIGLMLDGAAFLWIRHLLGSGS